MPHEFPSDAEMTSSEDTRGTGNSRRATWDRVGRAVMIAAIAYMLGYVPYFLWQMYRVSDGATVSPHAVFPAHFVGMALNLTALIFTVRDLYLRSFSDPNRKLTWLLLILCTGGIGWMIYIFKHALKPRAMNHGADRVPTDGPP
ncbi:MAG: hypothetical protein GXP27_09260 [Planctomycetes bacterium]|nr:hypothetical protein [Planctomycetota bacterium]